MRSQLSSCQPDREAVGVLVGRVNRYFSRTLCAIDGGIFLIWVQVTSKDVFVLGLVATPVLEDSPGIGSCGYSVSFHNPFTVSWSRKQRCAL